MRAVAPSLLSPPCLCQGCLGSHAGAWVMSGLPSAICNAFFSKSVSQSQPRTSQPRSSQPPPHSSIKKASTDLLADIGGDPFAAPQGAPAFAAFPACGGKQEPSYNICTHNTRHLPLRVTKFQLALSLFTRMNVMVILRHQGWEDWDPMSIAGIM